MLAFNTLAHTQPALSEQLEVSQAQQCLALGHELAGILKSTTKDDENACRPAYFFMYQMKLLNTLGLIKSVCKPWGTMHNGNDFAYHFNKIATTDSVTLLRCYESVFRTIYDRFDAEAADPANAAASLWAKVEDIDYFKVIYRLECMRNNKPFDNSSYHDLLEKTVTNVDLRFDVDHSHAMSNFDEIPSYEKYNWESNTRQYSLSVIDDETSVSSDVEMDIAAAFQVADQFEEDADTSEFIDTNTNAIELAESSNKSHVGASTFVEETHRVYNTRSQNEFDKLVMQVINKQPRTSSPVLRSSRQPKSQRPSAAEARVTTRQKSGTRRTSSITKDDSDYVSDYSSRSSSARRTKDDDKRRKGKRVESPRTGVTVNKAPTSARSDMSQDDGHTTRNIHVVSASVSYDKRQQRFMAQWKTREGTKHSKSFYAKRYATPLLARKHAELYKMYILQHKGKAIQEMEEPTYEQLAAQNFQALDEINITDVGFIEEIAMSHVSRVTFALVTSVAAVCVTYFLWYRGYEEPSEPIDDATDESLTEQHIPSKRPDVVLPINSERVKLTTVYYASQTGTAERLAKALALLLVEWHDSFGKTAVNLEDWDEEKFSQPGTIAIFTVSTHDDGLFPDNAEKFVKWLHLLEQDGRTLDGLSFSIFGLGSSEYPLFNKAAKTLQHTLKKLGARELHGLALGDDSCDLKSDFEQWTRGLYDALANELHIIPMPFKSQPKVYNRKVTDTWRDIAPLELRYVRASDVVRSNSPMTSNVVCKQQWQCSDYVVLGNFNMTPNADSVTHCVSVRSDSTFTAAETANILYENPVDIVKYFMGKLNLKNNDLDRWITFVPRDGTVGSCMTFDPPFPVPCTIRDALFYYLDLTGLPDDDVLWDMGTFLQTNSDCQLYNKLFERQGLLKTMRDELNVVFPEFVAIFMRGTVFNIGGFFQIVPKKIPKPYTISSHPKMKRIDLTVKLVTFRNHTFKRLASRLKRELGYKIKPANEHFFSRPRMYKGACTHCLCSLGKGDVVKLYRRPSAFSHIEGLREKPLVMVSNGSGIAPLRALWQDEDIVMERLLFLGFRNDEHMLYKGEIEHLKTLPNYTVYVAFSRTGEQLHVQHLLRSHIKKVDLVLKKGGSIFVCGSKSMGAQLKAIIQHFLNVGIDDLKSRQQYVEELW
ncbi:NADPH--cytochrome P450 reductase [Babesia sp. Xinjiang]|uniref:NADPH--cytochrome P450 reductase n=1 Tax=Babesia sp. Xinjiang TaxID=462227 RepID=UPI000A237AB1|nr:NADPH--cytochrome P450 reductase [Babesia sp. Xinjiang]ORM40560.1 NADPH--cytochrome P450 reductase [Babesia sp. Xinjiang]